MLKIFAQETPFFVSFKNNLLHVIAIKPNKETVKVESFAKSEAYPDAFREGEIVQKEFLGKVIADLLTKSRPKSINHKTCYISLPDYYVFSKTIVIPRVKEKEIDPTIRYKIKNFLPHKLEEMYVDWYVLRESKNTLEMAVVAASKTLIDSYIDTLQLINIFPLGFEPESCSLARIATGTVKELALIIYCNHHTATFSFVENGGVLFVFTRNFVSEDEVENEKELVEGIELASQFYQNNLAKERQLKSAFLAGYIAKELVISQKIQDYFNLAPIKLSPPTIVPREINNEVQKDLVPLFGLSLSQLVHNGAGKIVSLIPYEIKQKREYAKFLESLTKTLKLNAVFLSVFIAFFLFIYLSIFFQTEVAVSTLSGLEKMIVTPRQAKLETQALNLNQKTTSLSQVLAKRKIISPILLDVAKKIPAGIVISDFSLDSQKKILTMKGLANKREDILVLEKSLSSLGQVTIPLSSFEENKNAKFNVTVVLK
jgi:Tfp pilus assembly PilM family ATPase/Tfp pilus assembly protein PilN